MGKRKGIILAAVGVCALVALWLAMSPGWAVSAMRDAAKADDEQRVAGYVDQDSVRRGLAQQFAAQIAYSTAPKGNITPKAGVDAMNTAMELTSRLDTVKPIAIQLAKGDDPVVTRTGVRSFTAETGAGALLSYRLQGLTWRVVDMQPVVRK